LLIAENRSGDWLFLKRSASGKTSDQVFVFWDEEQRSEVFAPTLEKLIEDSSAAREPAAPPRSNAKKV
jgi:hypothetical protein